MVVGGEEVVGQLLHWTSLRYVVQTGVPHMSVSLFSRPNSSVSAPRCALGAEQVIFVPWFKCGTVPSCYPSPKCGGFGYGTTLFLFK